MDKEHQVITLDELMDKIKVKVMPGFDCVVAIERGGVLPGYLAARYLNIPLFFIRIQFKDDSHKPLYDKPKIEKNIRLGKMYKKILLTDDVSNSGSTLKKAKSALKADVTTMVISGNADISLYGPHNKCIKWPWEQ